MAVETVAPIEIGPLLSDRPASVEEATVQNGGHEMSNCEFQPIKRFRPYLVALLLPLTVGLTCPDTDVVYRDTFNSTSISGAPLPPEPPIIGTSSVTGDVIVVHHPLIEFSTDHWLDVRRTDPLVSPEYVATFEKPVTNGTVALVGYIPDFDPSTMSVSFNTSPPSAPAIATLLRIDLKDDGTIAVNGTDEGTYVLNTSVGFLVTFNTDDSPPTAILLVRGGAEDAFIEMEITEPLAVFGVSQVTFEIQFTDSGRFLIDDVVATQNDPEP